MSVGVDAAQHEGGAVTDAVDASQRKGRAKRFVGGFVSNLMSVPKFMSKGRNPPQVAPQPTQPPPTIIRTPPSTLPLGPLNSSPRALATRASGGTEPLRLRTPPPSRSTVPSYANEDTTFSSGSGPSSHGPPTPPQPSANLADLPNPHDSKFDATPVVSDPEQVDLRLTADYDAMTDPDYTTSGGESTFSSRVNNVGKFINDFANLPWVGSTVAQVYSPFESRRARYRDAKQPGQSWYTKEIPEKVDLLATPPQPRRRRTRPVAERHETRQNAAAGPSEPRRHHPPQPSSKKSRDAAAAPKPTHSPRSHTSGGPAMPSPSSSSHGQQPYSYVPYYPPAQPYYLVSPQQSPTAGQPHEAGALPTTALPMSAAPQPVFIIPAMQMLPPGSPVAVHHGHPHYSPQLVPQFPIAMPAPVPVVPLSPPHSSSSRTRPLEGSPPTIATHPRSSPRAPQLPQVASSSGSGGGLLSPRNSQPKSRAS